MIEFERIDELCQRLGLGTMATHLTHVAQDAARNELSFQEFFERLLQAEYRERQERSRTLLTRTAGFPAIKTLEQYDFGFAVVTRRRETTWGDRTPPYLRRLSGFREAPPLGLTSGASLADTTGTMMFVIAGLAIWVVLIAAILAIFRGAKLGDERMMARRALHAPAPKHRRDRHLRRVV